VEEEEKIGVFCLSRLKKHGKEKRERGDRCPMINLLLRHRMEREQGRGRDRRQNLLRD